MFEGLKESLFQLGVYNKCPICGGGLIEYGYSDFGHKYKCSRCRWGHY